MNLATMKRALAKSKPAPEEAGENPAEEAAETPAFEAGEEAQEPMPARTPKKRPMVMPPMR
jgi:hypothetical protein